MPPADPTDPRAFLLDLFDTAVAAADPTHCLPSHLPPPPKGRTIVIGAGKAAASMARAVEAHWDSPIEGVVVTRYQHGLSCQHVEVIEAGHPVPDDKGLDAARRILAMAREAGEDDLVLCLISGGGSSLLALPGENGNGKSAISLSDKQAINRSLLWSGANITEMNTVRKHLSAIKGGRLAAAAFPAKVVTLAISDVPGDDPGIIASGPTVGDLSSSDDAMEILQRYGIELPPSAKAFLSSPGAETPRPDDPRLATASFELIATPKASLEAAAEKCRTAGCDVIVLGDAIEGEAREVGAEQAKLALQMKRQAMPTVVMSGGETTVTVKGDGRGGRNAEYLLGLTIALDGAEGIHALACDTDGIDGSEDNAGAVTGPNSLARARAAGLDPGALLANNDAYSFFSGIDDLIKTGPTRTNVNDFRAIMIGQKS